MTCSNILVSSVQQWSDFSFFTIVCGLWHLSSPIRTEPGPRQWGHRILTDRPAGNSQDWIFLYNHHSKSAAAAAAKSLQSCLTLCDPIDGSPPGSPVPGILQARTLEWAAISFSNAWTWKGKVKSVVTDSSRPHGLQPTRLLHPWDFPGKSTGVGCHCLLRQ